jgi:hypothetical protein
MSEIAGMIFAVASIGALFGGILVIGGILSFEMPDAAIIAFFVLSVSYIVLYFTAIIPAIKEQAQKDLQELLEEQAKKEQEQKNRQEITNTARTKEQMDAWFEYYIANKRLPETLPFERNEEDRKICKECGNLVPSESAFCNKCGSKL